MAIGRYRTVAMAMHADEKYRSLSSPEPNGKSLWHNLLFGPHTGVIPGLSVVGEMSMAEQLEWDLEGFRKAFGECRSKGMAKWDFKARVLWIPNAVKYNPPQNPNVVLSWGKAVNEIPHCDLKVEAISTLRSYVCSLGKAFAEAFDKSFGKPCPNGMANQEQEQEQEQEYSFEVPKAGVWDKEKPKKEKVERVRPSGPHHELIEYFTKAWFIKYGKSYPFAAAPGRNANAIKSILVACAQSLDESKKVVDRFMANTDDFLNGHDLSMLVRQITKFMVDAKPAGPKGKPVPEFRSNTKSIRVGN